MGVDEEVRVNMGFNDDYTDGVKKASKETDDLDRSLEDVSESSADANLRFIATTQAIDAVGGAVSKMRSGLDTLGIVSEETSKKIEKIEGGANLVAGSAQIAIVAMEAWTRASKNQQTALVGVAFAAAAVGSAMAAMNEDSEDQRKVFSVLTGITAGLAAAQFTLAAANAAARTTASGVAAPVTAALIAGSLVAVAAGLATYIASSKAAADRAVGLQTGAGVIKEARVLSSGQIASGIRVDAGEDVSIVARRPNVAESILQERRGGTLIREMNVTFVGAFNPWNPAENRKAAEVLGEIISRRTGGRVT